MTGKNKKLILKLFIVGGSSNSEKAIENLNKNLTQNNLTDYELSIIDVQESPELAISYHIIVLPTLIKTNPFPIKIIVGDMSKVELTSLMDAEA